MFSALDHSAPVLYQTPFFMLIFQIVALYMQVYNCKYNITLANEYYFKFILRPPFLRITSPVFQYDLDKSLAGNRSILANPLFVWRSLL